MSTPSPSVDSVASLPNGNVQHPSAAQQSRPTMRPHPLPNQHKPPSKSYTVPAPTRRKDSSATASPRYFANKSIPTSPEGPNGRSRHDRDALTPLILPKSPFPPQASPPSAMSDSFMHSGAGSIIRRLSRGTSHRLRRRTSTNAMRSRDQSSGPMRQRSDSRTVGDGSFEISDFELDHDDDYQSPVKGTFENGQASHIGTRMPARPRRPSRRGSEKDPVPMLIPLPPEGTVFTKMTRKKKKPMRFWLDPKAAKLSWSPHPQDVKKQIHVDDIREIRVDEAARNHVDEFDQPDGYLGRWLTIVYDNPTVSKGRSFKLMHLLAPNDLLRKQWTSSLRHLMRTRGDNMAGFQENNEAHWLKQWDEAQRKKRQAARVASSDDEVETLNFAELLNICRGFKIKKSEKDIKIQFDSADSSDTGELDLAEYVDFMLSLTEREDIRLLFDRLKSPLTGCIELDGFLFFLQDDQGVDVYADRKFHVDQYQKFASLRGHFSDVDSPSTGITLYGFRAFLTNDKATPPLLSTPPKPLNRPLNEYFISSSHNTYLTGRQVGGQSSPEAYGEALRNGCRCVEIDTADGEDGNPIVTHVKSLTSKTTFLDCVKQINQYAFFESEYPLIISLEVHCGPKQQRVMAEIMKEHFGSKILLESLHPGSHVLPSPEELKRRILIKVKVPGTSSLETGSLLPPPTAPIHRRQRSASAPNPRDHLTIPSLSDIEQDSPRVTASPTILPTSSLQRSPETPATSGSPSVPYMSSEDSDFDPAYSNAAKPGKPKTNRIVPELGGMGVYTRGVAFSSWASFDSRAYNHIYSFNETTFENKCKTLEGKRQLERHNTKSLMRVYPKGSRVSSGNFDPLQFWRRGVQMAATNWQTYDLGTQINNAMFAAGSDKFGYVLKPEELRRVRDENGPDGKWKKTQVSFSVEIISAQWLEPPENMRPGAEMNPYIEFEMYSAEDKAKGIATGEGGLDASARNGMSGIGHPLRKRTRIVEGNGYNPQFNESIFMTLTTKYPSLVFVRWTVWHSQDGRSLGKEPLASFTAKLSSLQQGYRHLALHNNRGEAMYSKLFCLITKKDIRDVEQPRHVNVEAGVDWPRSSEDTARSGKDFLRNLFSRTPSERKKSKDDTGYFSRTSSMERQAP